MGGRVSEHCALTAESGGTTHPDLSARATRKNYAYGVVEAGLGGEGRSRRADRAGWRDGQAPLGILASRGQPALRRPVRRGRGALGAEGAVFVHQPSGARSHVAFRHALAALVAVADEHGRLGPGAYGTILR